jgi:lipoic acid synthetase
LSSTASIADSANAARPRLPSWLRVNLPAGQRLTVLNATHGAIAEHGLHTVCEEARCPNLNDCWSRGTATFMVAGKECTRGCRFCSVETLRNPEPPDPREPGELAAAVERMELAHVVITVVNRDDLPDGGAWLYAETVRVIHELNPGTGVENLIPDFNGKPELLTEVFESRPEVLAHNVETVPRIFKRIRPAFRYDRSLEVLTRARDFGLVTKSNLILGMGETREEVSQALVDLHAAGCELVTVTQYLRPSARHHPVERWVRPEEFVELQQEAEEIGFSGVLSGPLVRSSYRAGRLYRQAMDARTAAR